ncbi:MAG: PQQ-dependent sugar dehydrogenase [Rubricoccaceae bacterium]
MYRFLTYHFRTAGPAARALAARALAAYALATLALAAGTHAQPLSAELAFPGVTFANPVELAVAPGEPDVAFVVEQGTAGPARILVVPMAAPHTPSVFLSSFTPAVAAGGERGLLGLAFHPEYAANGRFFVHYTAAAPRRSVLAEYRRSDADSRVADPASARVILEYAQPFDNHNAGKIAFGPDGYLYVATGDGGASGDPGNRAQNPAELLGKMLRLDVDTVPAGATYGIPASNPFVNTPGYRPEIYALGLRNAWKFSFDGDDLWLADVGQNAWEEINLIRAGGNYGWRQVEGPACFVAGCDLTAFDAPIFWYGHNNTTSGGYSVTGGFVYRGTRAAEVVGKYLFADFILPRLWALSYDRAAGTATSTLLTTTIPNTASIDRGPDGEAYVVSYNGTIYRLTGRPVSAETGPGLTAPFGLHIASAHPFREAVRLEARGAGPARVALYDALGREVAVLFEGLLAEGRPQPLRVEGRALAPGVYLARLAVPEGVQVLRLVRAE